MVRVKSLPGKVGGAVVVKGVWLGWLRNPPAQRAPGYYAFVITCEKGESDAESTFHAHLMSAPALDSTWRSACQYNNLTSGEANKILSDHELLAVWPERSQQ